VFSGPHGLIGSAESPPRATLRPIRESGRCGCCPRKDAQHKIPMRRKEILLVGAILSAGGLSRLFGITYGLPWLFYHPDESQIVLRALRFGTGDLNPHIFWWPGIFQMDLMFASYILMFVVERAAGSVASAQDFAHTYFRDPTPFYLIGRLLSVAMSLATVAIVYSIGRRYFGRIAAASAALLLAFNPLYVELSRITIPSAPMVFWVALSVWTSLRILDGGSYRWYLLAGLFSGLASLCYYYGGLVVVCVPLAHLLRSRSGEGSERGRIGQSGLLVAGAAFAGVFLLVCPYVALDFAGFRQDLLNAYHTYAASETVARTDGYLAGCVGCLMKSVGGATTLPIILACVAGIGLALRRHSGADLLISGYVVFYLALFGLLARHRAQHLAPILPFMFLLAGITIAYISKFLSRRVAGELVVIPTCGLLAAQPVIDILRTNTERASKDTRELARVWIEANIPPGTGIVMDAKVYRNTVTAPIEEARANIVERIDSIRSGTARGYGETSAYLRYYEMKLACYDSTHPGYNQWWTDCGLNVRSIEHFREQGYEYVMINTSIAERYLHGRMMEECPAAACFYASLDTAAVLIKEFAPEPWRRPGPTIRIYSLKQ
jgi:hypothetical protein